MIINSLFVLLFGAHLSRAAPQGTTTIQAIREGTDLGFREDYKYEPDTDIYYKEHITPKNWSEAIKTCKAEGAKLAIPFTKTEADVVQKHFTGKSYYTWLGIHDLFTEGKFITLNGTRATDIYTDWTAGEPNNAGGDENCVTINKAGKYNDVPCSLESTFVCTKRSSQDHGTTRNDNFVTTPKAPQEIRGETSEVTTKIIEIFDNIPEETTKIQDILVKTSDIYDEALEETTKIKEVFDRTLEEKIKDIFDKSPEETTKIQDILDKTSEIYDAALEETTKIQEILDKVSGDSNLNFIKGYKFEREIEMYYKEHTTPKNWSEAIATCKRERAKLAAPVTKTEADMIQKHFSGKSYYTWLGIHDLFIEGKFVTLDGTPAADIHANWNRGEPNNAGGDEDCVTMNKDGKYNDVPCNILSTFICTKHGSDITLNDVMSKCETTDEDYFFEAETDRCYKIHITPMSWYESYRTCENEEATLAMANSQTEADLFSKYLTKYPENSVKGNFVKENIFLDFTDLITRGQFLTGNGKTLEESGYSAWLEGRPGYLDDEEHCGSLRRDGKLDYLGCKNKTLFICEKTPYSSPQLTDIGKKDTSRTSFFSALFYYFENI